MNHPDTTRAVGIYLFDKVELFDFAGPFKVFSTALRVHVGQQPDIAAPSDADSGRGCARLLGPKCAIIQYGDAIII